MSQPSGPVSSLPASLSDYESLQLLVDDIRGTCPEPINTLQIAALLESSGVTDAIAEQRYGYRDVFGVAGGISGMLAGEEFDCEPQTKVVAEPEADWRSAAINYLRGPLGVVPLALLMTIVGAFESFGQWQGSRALTLSAATIGSLLVTGGFVQIAARKGSSYLSQGYARAAGRFVVRAVGVGVGVVILTAFPLVWVGRATGWLEATDAPFMMVAYVALSCLWLLSAMLSIFKRVHWFGIALALGVGLSRLSLIGLERLSLGAHVGVGIAAGVGFVSTVGVGGWVLARAIATEASASESGDHVVMTPPLPQLVVNLVPYFLYGIVYILVVLSGHVGGWVGRLPAGLGRMDAIAQSELGLTLALVGYILVGGVTEETMQRFWQWVHVYQAQTQAAHPEAFSEKLRRFARRERKRFAGAFLLSTDGVLIFVALSLLLGSPGMLMGLTWGPDLGTVFVLGLVGCGLLGLGAFDCMLLITLSRPWPAVGALAVGTVTTLLASVGLGHWVGFAYGAGGMVVGNLVAFLVAHRGLGRVLRHADYYYFTSF